jgi:hypothetical protein
MFSLALTSLSISNALGVSDTQSVENLRDWNQKCASLPLIFVHATIWEEKNH